MYSNSSSNSYSDRKGDRSNRPSNRSRYTNYTEGQSRSRHHSVPTADQITKLVQTIVSEPGYDPLNWSILDTRDQHSIQKVIYHTPIIDLSVRRVLQATGLSETPSTISYIIDGISKKFNSFSA